MIAEGDDLRQQAQDELHRILQSPAFHSSPRCKQFLQFVVERALEGQYDLLKERMIGIEVFGRKPSYQTEGDSVVRVRASDVRRRLVQYYSVTETGVCRIDIPCGSYIPHFLPPRSEPSSLVGIARPTESIVDETCAPQRVGVAPTFQMTTRMRRLIVTGSLIFAALLAFFVTERFGRQRPAMAQLPRETSFQAFWAPAFHSSKPILICIGSPVTYSYSKAFRAEYMRSLHLKPDDHPDSVIEPIGLHLTGSDVLPVRDEYVGAGDANAASLLSVLFGGLGKTTVFRISSETSYSDLSDSPTILLGAFSNRWTEQAMSRAPFVFAERDAIRFIQETTGDKRTWALPQLGVDGKTDEDFAIVSRILDAETGQFLVTAAGISGFGSRAAGYFLTRPDQMSKELDRAPKGWRYRNLQFVLRTHVVDGAPTAPEIVAVECW